MTSPPRSRWYHDFLAAERPRPQSEEQSKREVAYLARVLEAAPGSRVLEVGCGTGVRAIELARAGYDVVGVDVSETALELASRAAEGQGVAVRFTLADPLADEGWPSGPFDAAVCLESIGFGTSAEDRRLLRRLRRVLVRDGLLVLERSPAWLMSVSSDAPDAASGRVRGTIRPQGAAFDVRVYSTPELCALLRETGFRVERIDGELTPDRSVAGEEGRAELVGRALPVLPRVLAVSSWWTPASVALDLRYAPDEAELLDPQPQRIWHSLVDSLPESGAHVVGGYAVDDPYGGERGAVVVAGYFGCPLASRQVTFGAGVTSLLHALAGLADGGVVLASELVHGDLEAWVLARGAETHLVPDRLEVSELARAIEVARPALVHLDRPTFTGRVLPLAQLAAVARVASRVGAPVLVDESAAPYLGGNGSAATLVPDADNLVVLRGFTKAYSLGGLRAAFVVASDGVAGRIRELVPPLQVGELALQAALRLLAAGDVFAPLRARVEEVKPAVVDELRAAGFDVEAGTAMLPWVAVADRGGEATRSLDRYGIRALAPAPPPGAAGAGIEILRLTIPLAEHRVELLRRLLRSDPGPGGDAARAMPDGRLSAWPQDL